MVKKITFYFDIVSPFAYIAHEVIKRAPAFKQCEIEYVPIFLGGLMKATNNRPPIAIKNKDIYINTSRLRLARLCNVPISATSPPSFPPNTLPIQRALASLSISHPHLLSDAMTAFWQHTWVSWNEPTRPDNIVNILMSVFENEGGDEGNGVWGGMEMEMAEEVVEAGQGEEVKAKLKENTERAFKEGGFGVPWFVATNEKGETEGFWGVDHMGMMCDHLGIERPEGKGFKSLL